MLSSLSSSIFSIQAGLGIIWKADLSTLLEKILLLKPDLGDKDGTGTWSLSDCLLLQNILPKKLILGGVIAKVVEKAVLIIVVDSALLSASSSLSETPDCSKPTLSNLTEIKKKANKNRFLHPNWDKLRHYKVLQ